MVRNCFGVDAPPAVLPADTANALRVRAMAGCEQVVSDLVERHLLRRAAKGLFSGFYMCQRRIRLRIDLDSSPFVCFVFVSTQVIHDFRDCIANSKHEIIIQKSAISVSLREL